MNTFFKCAVGALSFAASQAFATPVTFAFSGTSERFLYMPDYTALDAQDAAFSGTITFDAAVQETIVTQHMSGATSVTLQESGCGSYVNGVCSHDSGPADSAALVVTQLTLQTSAGLYVMKPNLQIGTTSGIVKSYSDGTYQSLRYFLSNDILYQTGSPEAFDLGNHQQYATINLTGTNGLFSDIGNLSEVPNLLKADAARLSYIDNFSQSSCKQGFSQFVCSDPIYPVDAAAQISFDGRITEIHRLDAANVPEPASFALLGLGVAGIAVLRRRRA